MIDAPLAYAFAVGLFAAVNPCGFPMLPAYLSFFLGTEGTSRHTSRTDAITRALAVGASVSAGFMLVFGVAGALLAWTSVSVEKYSQWITLVLGVVLVGVGIAMLRGKQPTLPLPKLNKGGRTTEGRSMFVFGMSYAIASISCTVGLFITAVTSVFDKSNFVSGIAVFIAYSAGMALVVLALTVSMALATEVLLGFLRNSLRYVTRVSGALLVLVGAYMAYYAWIEIENTQRNHTTSSAIVDRMNAWSADVQNWIQNTGSTRVGLILALIVAAAGVVVAVSRRPAR